MRPQLQYYKDRCLDCGKCVDLCPNHVHSMQNKTPPWGKPEHSLDRKSCSACGVCANECIGNALVISGRGESIEEVMRQVLDDKPYYDESGGGVTLSGGEPVLQGDFCEALLKSCRDEGIHTNIQTAGFYDFELLDRLLPFLDLVMYDIKGMTPEIHNQYVHNDSGLALDNLMRLDKKGIPVIVRMPCVKGVNDSPGEIEAAAKMLSGLRHLEYFSILPCHNLAKVKYDILGMEFKLFEPPLKEQIQKLELLAARYVKVYNPEVGFL